MEDDQQNKFERLVSDWIDKNEQDLVEMLRKMIRWPTVTPDEDHQLFPEPFGEHQRWIKTQLEALGFSAELWEIEAGELPDVPGRGVRPTRSLAGMPVVAARFRGSGGGRSLILNGHYDVVPAGDPALWDFPPFSGAVSNGRVYGRGAVDMKGGNAAMLFALQALRTAGFSPAGDLVVQIVPDEEATSMGTLACCLRGMNADAGLIPEPTGMDVLVAMRGSVYGTIRVHGRSGHAEMVQPPWTEGGAVNAIAKAALVIQALEQLADRWRRDPGRTHPLIGPDSISPTVIRGGEWDVTIPDLVEIQFGAQYSPHSSPPGNEIREALARLGESDDWFRHHPVEVDFTSWIYPAEVDADAPVVRLAQDVLKEMGLPGNLAGYGSLTDAVHLINVTEVPTISIGPETKTMHSVNEYIEIKELLRLAKAIAVFVIRWSGKQQESDEEL